MSTESPVVTASDLGVIGCTRCTRVWPAGTAECGRCGHKLHPRDNLSLSRVWAWWTIGLICYVPANVYPMLQTRTLTNVQESTIVGGAVELAEHGNLAIAAIILIASVLIPMGKFGAIAFLALTANRQVRATGHQRTLMYELVEYIGRWSMIDVFVVAVLSALVQLSSLAAINPGVASFFFAASVICTMLSAQSFDPRMIWDRPTKRRLLRKRKRLPA